MGARATQQKTLTTLICKTKANDVDEKGILTLAVNGIGIKDADDDISMPGSFKKTLNENIDRCKWFLNHDKTQLLGVPISGDEKDGNLVMVGKINLEKQIGKETYADYKLYAEYGKTLEHSVGVSAIKRDKSDPSKVLEWFLGEYSTLTHWGANPQTFLMDIKGLKGNDLSEHINMMRKALNERYSDDKLKALETNLNLISKALIGDSIVQCPACGYSFDYSTQNEMTLEKRIVDLLGQYTGWLTENIVLQEVSKLEPDIRDKVVSIIDAINPPQGLTTKSIEDISSFVRCPHCYAKVYRSNVLIEPDKSTQKETKAAESTFSLKSIADMAIR